MFLIFKAGCVDCISIIVNLYQPIYKKIKISAYQNFYAFKT